MKVAHIIARSRMNPCGGCWELMGAHNGTGYMQIGGDRQYVHRLSYNLHYGNIPDGLVVDHLCRNRACWNPEHLEAITQGENIRRAIPRKPKQVCINGHALDADNVRLDSSGNRRCVICRQETAKQWMRQKRLDGEK